MMNTARTIVFVRGLPVPATVTATRRDKPPTSLTLVEQDRQRSQDRVLHALLAGSGIPADGWTITTDPPERGDHLIQWPCVTIAGVAAVIRAAGAAGDGRTPSNAIFSGTWTPSELDRPPRPLSTPGLAIQARFAAEHGQTLVTHYHDSRPAGRRDRTLRTRFPRDRSLRYIEVASGADLIDVLNGHVNPGLHKPAQKLQGALENLDDTAPVLSIPSHALRAILPPFEHAVETGTPLLVSATPDETTSKRTREEAVAQLAVLLMPELTPTEQQEILETRDLADQELPANGRIERPARRPHWTTRPDKLRSTKTPAGEARDGGQPLSRARRTSRPGACSRRRRAGRRLDHSAPRRCSRTGEAGPETATSSSRCTRAPGRSSRPSSGARTP